MSDWRCTGYRIDTPTDRVAYLSLILADELSPAQVQERARLLARQLYGHEVDVGKVEPDSWSTVKARRPQST
ncbi:hypothetical protein [Rhodococcus sp. NPDC047139]|uniref:hypothetical protein n=1 Tax=Rhodococcus sp. NPDC047139 TaxID=3155141 RepID=UPI0033E8ED6A